MIWDIKKTITQVIFFGLQTNSFSTYSSRRLSHWHVFKFINIVRLALVTSVMYLPPWMPPVRFSFFVSFTVYTNRKTIFFFDLPKSTKYPRCQTWLASSLQLVQPLVPCQSTISIWRLKNNCEWASHRFLGHWYPAAFPSTPLQGCLFEYHSTRSHYKVVHPFYDPKLKSSLFDYRYQ